MYTYRNPYIYLGNVGKIMMESQAIDDQNFYSVTLQNDLLSCIMRKPAFAYAKTKAQISFTVTTQVMSSGPLFLLHTCR